MRSPNSSRIPNTTNEPPRKAVSSGGAYAPAKTKSGAPVDRVARFHLGNGARLERLNWFADSSEGALGQSHGLMVNYLYDLEDIEKNHEAYAQQRSVVASSAVTRLARTGARDLVPAATDVGSVFL